MTFFQKIKRLGPYNSIYNSICNFIYNYSSFASHLLRTLGTRARRRSCVASLLAPRGCSRCLLRNYGCNVKAMEPTATRVRLLRTLVFSTGLSHEADVKFNKLCGASPLALLPTPVCKLSVDLAHCTSKPASAAFLARERLPLCPGLIFGLMPLSRRCAAFIKLPEAIFLRKRKRKTSRQGERRNSPKHMKKEMNTAFQRKWFTLYE